MRLKFSPFPIASLVLSASLAGPARAQTVPAADSSLSRAINGPTRPQNTRGSSRRQQIFSEAYSASAHGPYYVNLDSGVTYRVFVDQSGGQTDQTGRTSDTASANLTITPRVSSLPPIRFSPTMFSGNNGAAFEAPATTGYRVETFYSGREAIIVRIYREAVDVYSAACVTDPTAAGCRAATDVATRPKTGVSPAVLIMIGFLPLLFMGMMRNGKSF